MRVQAVGIQKAEFKLMELCHATLPHCSSMLNSTYAFRLALLRTPETMRLQVKTVTHRSFRSGLRGQRARYNPPLAPMKIFSLTIMMPPGVSGRRSAIQSSRRLIGPIRLVPKYCVNISVTA